MINAFDSNNDGKISRHEFISYYYNRACRLRDEEEDYHEDQIMKDFVSLRSLEDLEQI